MPEVLYKNAPLVEVIAEVRWALAPLATVQNGAVDPFFEIAAKQLSKRLETEGYTFVETLVPAEVPREILAGQVINRFRKQAGAWPVFQIGPGVFTANVVQPYEGWKTFVPHIALGCKLLFESYPAAEHTMRLSQLHLRYLDGFTIAHGRKDHVEYVRSDLDVTVGIGDNLRKALNLPSDAPAFAQLELNYPVPEGEFILKLAPGKKENLEATVMELILVSNRKEEKPDVSTVMNWYDTAHARLSDAFEATTSDRVKKLMSAMEKK